MGETLSTGEEYANWKGQEVASQPKSPEVESGLDFVLMEQYFADGTAGELYNNTGAVSVEGIALEPQGDERTLPEIPSGERAFVEQKFAGTVSKYNLQLVKDEVSCMAIAA